MLPPRLSFQLSRQAFTLPLDVGGLDVRLGQCTLEFLDCALRLSHRPCTIRLSSGPHPLALRGCGCMRSVRRVMTEEFTCLGFEAFGHDPQFGGAFDQAQRSEGL